MILKINFMIFRFPALVVKRDVNTFYRIVVNACNVSISNAIVVPTLRIAANCISFKLVESSKNLKISS